MGRLKRDTSDIRQMASDGQTAQEIADRIGHSSRSSVYKWARRDGINLPAAEQSRTRQPRHMSDIESLAAAGLTMAEIGREVGLTRERVRQLCNKHGIEVYRHGALTPQEIERVTECAEQDMRFDETVEATRISAWRVQRIAKHIGHEWNRASRRILDICDRIRPLAAQGLSLGEIGAIVGLPEKHVQTLDVKYGLGVRRKPNAPGRAGVVPREEFVELVESGLSGQEIADRIGVTPAAVYARKRSLGLTRKARHV